MTATSSIRVDRDRLWASLMELKEIGAYHDDATGMAGVRRLALTDADAVARRRCVTWMLEAGLEVRVDRIGNVYATRAGNDRSLPSVLMGSHIDTVATGGAFDGTLGVLGGIEVMRSLDEAGVETLRDVEVGFLTEEEGVRFGIDMLGSAVTAGRIPIEYGWQLADLDGHTVRDELERIGFDGPFHERRPVPHAYIECHIEQGPILADAGVSVGIVEGVHSISWQRLTVHGEAAHAGTTPIGSRHDAGLVAAHVVIEASRMCESGDYGSLRATIGNFDIGEGQANVIPHQAVITVDLRNPDDERMTAAEKDLAAFLEALAEARGVTVEWERMAKTAVIPFDATVQDLLAEAAHDLGLPFVRAMSGAGHDAQEIAAIFPTAMVFARGENGGISHNPREYSTPDACGDGIDVLANAVVRLANQPQRKDLG
jgi:N-carbamoyl-L-amino-acid hydrolase